MGILAGILGGLSGAAKAGIEVVDKNEKERIAKEASDLAYKRDMAMEAFRNNNATKLQNDRIAADKDAANLDRNFRAGESRLGREHDVTMEQKRSENNMANTILSGNQQTARDNLNREANREDSQQQHDWKMAEQRDAAERNLANSITEFNMKVAAGNMSKDTKTAVDAWSKELSALIQNNPSDPRVKILQGNIDKALGTEASAPDSTELSDEQLLERLGSNGGGNSGGSNTSKPSASDRLGSVVEDNNNADLNANITAGFNKDLELANRDIDSLVGVKPYEGGLLSSASAEQDKLDYHLKRLDRILSDKNATPEQKQQAEAMIAKLEQGLRK